jgi:hypothetical protein
MPIVKLALDKASMGLVSLTVVNVVHVFASLDVVCVVERANEQGLSGFDFGESQHCVDFDGAFVRVVLVADAVDGGKHVG